ncbi:MAG TPA: bifunctional 4-hydroxy-2-oxoglutarate aldolase/2-dehydro-3-deoxy-phosphogluconate aldolase [Termitinemataceae bacterium]|nr:bifunctional 4-hydroxy-2-oxoglutarate aldolase/2-dehydro-3-deoxy-phosphogluconate aldolase [Termitinemataceae bacterium]HOM22508.1 bifunctional 4-hydroxy-2-oxoglutarate aldolase/2-dehydro-3-deoxy-phosphogluconate aldolase [Termitinemataceae bacterium]HPQ00721.1 bifunctional 4-hydroxy-2-oxoglutarate aldolase/2-dehydro-3-deoxy-phosphogluconate aldolase [Termitinemataceae bacterium]
MNDLFLKIRDIGLVPVIKIDNPDHAVPLGRALVAGGLPVAEVTFRTDAAEEAIRRMKAELPELLVGAGTVINPALAQKAVQAGASFIVSPGFNPATVDWCLERNIPVLPGVNNPSLIEQGLSRGLEVFKFFPAENSGGAPMIQALSAPFGSIQFVPTGGIDANNLAEYAKLDAVLAIGGSWMVKADLIQNEQWDTITALCREARLKLQGFSFAHLGINQDTPEEAKKTANVFAALGFALKEGNSSIFAGTPFEIMKSPFRGTKGHIAISCYNVERALAYLAPYGFKGVEETAKREKGKLKVIYLDKEIGGFAVHLVKA